MATTTGTASTTGLRTFSIDKAHSEATFQVRHLITKVRGRFRDFEGNIQFDEAKPDQLKPAADAHTLDNSNLDIEAGVRAAIAIVEAVKAARGLP